MKRIFACVLLLATILSGCNSSSKIVESMQPSEMTPQTEEPSVSTVTYETYYVVNCEESIAMYTSADINSTEICEIPFGASVSYIQPAENGFYQIAYQGNTGYAFATCLSDTAPQEKPKEEPVEPVNYETYYVVNCEESISMYTSADIDSTEICEIPFGASVSYIQSAENGFYQIAYQGDTGYALAACLSDTAPQEKPKEEPVEPVNYETYYVVNCNEYITLRSAPTTDSSSVCKIPFGSAVSHVGTADNGFYKVIYNGKTGYALASYLSQDPQKHSKPQESVSTETYSTCYVVNCKKSITLRTSPSSSAGEYCQIPLGSAVSYVGSASNGFYKVIYNGHTGYALASYLSFSKPTASSYDTIWLEVVNCKKSITLRTAPSTKAGEYCQIPLGAYVEFLGTSENGFHLVSYNGYTGYALASYLY